jgi:hypothetical protein
MHVGGVLRTEDLVDRPPVSPCGNIVWTEVEAQPLMVMIRWSRSNTEVSVSGR